jgi:hypothetical protein
MRYLVSLSLVSVGFIHLLPFLGTLGGAQLSLLYGIRLEDPNSLILLRHRAVLFGILGSFFIFSAFKPGLEWPALCVALFSVGSFLLLAKINGSYNKELARVVTVDIIVLAALFVGMLAQLKVTLNQN